MRRLGKRNVVLGIDRNPRSFPFRGKWEQCDLRNSHQLRKIMDKFNPQVVIHTAAWVDVDGCQVNPTKAKESNETLTKLVVKTSPHDLSIFTGAPNWWANKSSRNRAGPISLFEPTSLVGLQVGKKPLVSGCFNLCGKSSLFDSLPTFISPRSMPD